MPDGLRLEVTEYTDLTRWRWVLTDPGGAFLADHEVRLDPASQEYETFTTLHDWIEWHAAPDKRSAEEARIVATIGDWIGAEVFGPRISAALLQKRPATVEVILPEGADKIAYLPLEAARIESRSLAAHDLTLVIRPHTSDDAPAKAPATDTLRVLGLFSLPEGGTALNLRRERQSLVKLFDTIAANGRAAEVKVVQYGVTRDRLRDILEDGDGWDIIHISGHGTPGQLTLETADGTPDHIEADALADLLDLTHDRVKLVTVSACWSAAQATAEPRHQLGLEPQDSPERIFVPPPPQSPPPGDIATTLSTRLGCAVLAMRFPVADEFSIELAGELYDLLARQGQPLPRAVSLSLRHLTESVPARRWPALSMAAPAIFGSTASALTLKAPPRTAPASYATDHLKLSHFPPHPERFVGRTAVMTRASAVLAPDSGIPGIVLHGMPGGGKTACALELAYTHEDAFEKLIWFKAPDEGAVVDASLTDFALTLERDLPGLQMIDKVVSEPALTSFLPQLTELMERNRLLIDIDNAESLLTDSGQWRDPRWGQVIAALTDHAGLGRLILTSRRVPAIAPDVSAETRRLRVLPVDALSPDEALLLARELPHLNDLIRGTLPGISRDDSRSLAIGVLNTAQGHPKLLELADGQAANPDQLAALIESGDQAWLDQGGLPQGFFADGTTARAPGDYLHVLAAWTKAVTGTLSHGERDLFWFLCCLEEPDRQRYVLANWADLWQRLRRDGDPPELDRTLAAVIARSLAAADDESYVIHPGVAAVGRDHAGPDFQDATDTETAAYWDVVFGHASGKTGDGAVDTGLAVRSGLAAVPYLLRRQQWDDAGYLLDNAFIRDRSRENAAAVLPAIDQITRHDPRHAVTLGRVLRALDPAAGEVRLRAALHDAAARGDHAAASRAAGELVTLCRVSGRLATALTLSERVADHTRQARHGPWTQLSNEVQRLQVLTVMGQAEQVLADVQHHRDRLATLPATPGPNETVLPWDVREMLLDTGHAAALRLGRWQDSLDLNAEIAASERDRRAPAAATARTRFNDYGPLLRLGRTREARDLLLDCRQAFADAHNIRMLGMTLGALAHTEDKLGHGDAAIRLQRDALRYSYQAGDVPSIANIYHNLGIDLHRHARQPAPALASHLTAALISALTGADGSDRSVHDAVIDLRKFGAAAAPPADIKGLCRTLGNIPGTDPAGLIMRLSPDSETAEQTLRDLIAQVQAMASPKRKFWQGIRRRRRA